MEYITKKSAKNYYNYLLMFHEIEFNPSTKISTLKSVLENEILTDVTGINHFFDKYEKNIKVEEGQKNWLLEKKYKNKDRYGNPQSGIIRSDIVSGIINIVEKRNIAEHEKENITVYDYLGIFSQMVKIIEYFSNEQIPDEIKNILNNNSKRENNIKDNYVSDELFEEKKIIKENKTGNYDDNSEKNVLDVEELSIIKAYLIDSMSHREIERNILNIDSPVRGGGFKVMSILHDLGITGSKKGSLKNNSIEEEIQFAKGKYLKTLLKYKKEL